MLADDKRQAALELLRAYAGEIRTEIKRTTRELSRELARVERGIAELSGVETGQTDTLPVAEPAGRYAGLSPQRAVEMFLLDHPGRAFRPSQVAKGLKAQGFTVANPRLLGTQVSVALGRAQAKGLAEATRVDGRRVYRSVTKRKNHNDEGD